MIRLAAIPLLLQFAGGGLALADWREEIGTFRIAVAASGDSVTAASRAEPFRLALEEALGLPVEIVPSRDYPAMIDAATRARIEYSIMSASAYSAAFALCECLEPLVIATSGDGASSYNQILVAKPGNVSTPAALKGRKVGMLQTAAAGGMLLAAHELRQQGLDFSSPDVSLVKFDSSELAIAALADGAIDAMLGWSSIPADAGSGFARGTLRQIAERSGGPFPVNVIWKSSAVPHRVHAIRKDLDGEAKTILRSLLGNLFGADPVAYDSIEPEFGGGFVAARQAQFEPLTAMFRERGLSTQPPGAEKK